MPEPANPISMKQPPEPLGVRKGRGDMNGDPALLMDKAAAQLAASLQEGVLQKMAGHSHNNHNHERFIDLTSRVLNGDEDQVPNHCSPEPPMFKGAEAPATNGTHHHNCPPHGYPELKVKIPHVVKQPPFESCSVSGTIFAMGTEGIISGTEQRQEVKKRRGRPLKPKPQPNLSSSVIPVVPVVNKRAIEGTGVTDEVWLFFIHFKKRDGHVFPTRITICVASEKHRKVVQLGQYIVQGPIECNRRVPKMLMSCWHSQC